MKKWMAAVAGVLAFSFCFSPLVSAAASTPIGSVLPEGFSGLEERVEYGWAYDYQKLTAATVITPMFSALSPAGKEMEQRKTSDQRTIYYVPGMSYLSALKPFECKPEELGKPLTGIGGMDILLQDETKYTYTFYQKGLTVAKAEAGKAAGSATAYRVDAGAYQTMINSLAQRAKEGDAYPLWLASMRSSRAQQIKLDILGKKRTVSAKDGDFLTVFHAMRWFTIKGTPVRLKNAAPPKSGNLVQILFESKVTYTLAVTEKTLTIYSSDMDFALRYQLVSNELDDLNRIARGEKPVPMTAKPVLYLYPAQAADVSVSIGWDGRLGETIPAYHGGWNVTAYPDGRIVNIEDDAQYPYLFWDGWLNVDWDFSKGFCVAGAETAYFLQEKLTEIGLNESEQNEFIDYWLAEMQKNPYNLITFSTDQYDMAAPLTITPQPDRLLRVHMVYRPLQKPVAIKPQTFEKFSRMGFSAVEWGGTRA